MVVRLLYLARMYACGPSSLRSNYHSPTYDRRSNDKIICEQFCHSLASANATPQLLCERGLWIFSRAIERTGLRPRCWRHRFDPTVRLASSRSTRRSSSFLHVRSRETNVEKPFVARVRPPKPGRRSFVETRRGPCRANARAKITRQANWMWPVRSALTE